MTLRFLHAADIHLGNRQYGNQERHDDFTRAFEAMVQDALASKVDLVLLAGDIFHKRVVEPRTFIQAANLLDRLRTAGIPVLAVEGNHERPYYQERFSWLDGLAELKLVRALTTQYQDGKMVVEPYNDRRKTGAYYDIQDVRVYGQKYVGASTSRVVDDLTEALASSPEPRPAYAVLMLHAGLEGILDHYSGTLSRSNLDGLRPHVDYIAMGHIHKPFSQDDWIYNPGSLETNSIDEARWQERGYYIVETAPGQEPPHEATLRTSRRRRFDREPFEVDPYETPEALYAALESRLEGLPPAEDQPVFELRLTGVLNFGRADLDLGYVQTLVEQRINPLICQVQDQTASNTFEIRTDQEQTRQDLERQVLTEILERDVRRRGQSARWAAMALQLKRMALARSHPEEIIGELRSFVASLPPDGEEEDDHADS